MCVRVRTCVRTCVCTCVCVCVWVSLCLLQVHSEQYNISDLQSTAPFTSLSRRVTPSTSPLLTPTIASTVASTPTQNAFDFSASRTSSAPATAHDNPALRRTSSTDDEDEWVRVTHTAARGTEIDCGTSPNSSHYKPPPSSPNLSQFRGANFVSSKSLLLTLSWLFCVKIEPVILSPAYHYTVGLDFSLGISSLIPLAKRS